MDIKHFKKLIKKVEKLDEEPEFYGKVSLQDIEKVAQALNLKFDDQITTYLQEFGGGGIPDILNTNGIIPEDHLLDNFYTLFGATSCARKEFGLPENFIVIDADFPEKCWVLACDNPNENNVFAYNCFNQKIENQLYSSFQEYLFTEWEQFVEENED
ncbi:SMI1/KNR4 family protein [Empedobacter falsenii]|uniref:SMI1/KNR4 family protein n=1 Tax=Empedobacter falsenii TaxID=343874 RepID=UPI0025756CDD|nr:SMI1/KNR4 family protein [Empedobacter falsenii]MDM1298323.1 SMI1/KNR4 family protein [Empedobacter falsenii]MDM1318120.1 SMI1/KNR4 family protein [Empedobacter falsenii]